MRIPKAVLGGFLVLVLVAAGVYFFVLDKSPAAPGTPAETSAIRLPPRPPPPRIRRSKPRLSP